MNRKLFRLGMMVAAVFFLTAFLIYNSGSKDKEWPARIHSGTKFSITRFISVHESPIHVLTIDGKRFEGVCGFKPFYLRVPDSNMIVFVTEKLDYPYETVWHVFDMDTDDDLAISHQSLSGFGNTIGFSGGFEHDSVKMSDRQIILCCDDSNAVSTLPYLSTLHEIRQSIYIDLVKRALVADKTVYYDKDGKILDQRDAEVP
jgi:hypothetical protein